MRSSHFLLASALLVAACKNNVVAYYIPGNTDGPMVVKEGKTLRERFRLPSGYHRFPAAGITGYLGSLPLKPHGADVLHYDGSKKYKNVHAAVIDMEIGDKNLQQCADAVMRLRAEYLYSTAQYQKIHFNFTNGFRADYSKWMEGYRIEVNGNAVHWVKAASPANDHHSFRQYLDVVFSYAGTLSLSRELQAVNIKDIQPGDVFIKGGSPGHAITVVDVAENAKGQRIFMLAQSYMPAQDIEILINPADDNISPWYKVDTANATVSTPEWDFTIYELKRFSD